ncbi:hypothetical protein GNI_057760 [Gregarina niphandrodes]|uniref:Uncharacterized protein n=1 Tax=Gregarina niphandrodes TaxID=110365 RepID=A0A023B8P8_GRENI|nr:hypothetical protein GNI_057760 [Gregarina niphandrodes]EZG69534.1 hypothetical protein GNI_057760 [Gregarina niphandrodes]|eukprot:XP_011130007.1 hypothetical protein GNI_057760 [Gregarina niphandrodes]
MGLPVTSRRASSKAVALTAVMTVLRGGDMVLTDPQGLGAVELGLRSERSNSVVKLKVAVPRVPPASALANFDVLKECSAAHIIRESCSREQAIDFGAALLSGVVRQVLDIMHEADMTKLTPKQGESMEKVLEAIAAALFTQWASDSQTVAQEAVIRFAMNYPVPPAATVPGWYTATAENWLPNGWDAPSTS